MNDECVLWWGLFHATGYGRFGLRVRSGIYAHRRIWEECFGPIPDGLHVLHKCDNPPCVNPNHLFLGDQMMNNRDMFTKGRRGNTTWKRWKKTPPTDRAIGEMKSLRGGGMSLREIGRKFGITHHTVKRLTERGVQ